MGMGRCTIPPSFVFISRARRQKKGWRSNLGRLRSGLTTKFRALVDTKGRLREPIPVLAVLVPRSRISHAGKTTGDIAPT